VDNQIYVGIEAEGRLRGVPTVFSQRPCTRAAEIANERGINHIFFGVRGHELSASDYEVLFEMLDCDSFGGIRRETIVSLHVAIDRLVDVPAWALSRCHTMLYMPFAAPELLNMDIEVKLENQRTAAIFSRPQMLDLVYLSDKDASRDAH
jgi:hypothetical protein